MKPKTKNEYIEEQATEAMKCILTGIWSHPLLLENMSKSAAENKRPTSEEVALQSFMMAKAMYEEKRKFLIEEFK